MLQNIEVEKIKQHPDNPRKNLGDLSELVESIKANGVLQNLTVVPLSNKNDSNAKEEYCVVIGHRRLAAAKKAGLKAVPCIVSDMEYKDQVATMLLENMQRSDLTVYEQAQGFQMMINLGESVNDISTKTGFSKTTVRHRIKLLELNQEKFKKSESRGATLQDYLELEKIKNIELRNSVLEKIGTNDFNWSLKNAISKEKKEQFVVKISAELDKFATKIDNDEGMRYVQSYYSESKNKVVIPEDANTTEYFYQPTTYGSVYLYKRYEQTEAEAAEAAKQKQFKENKAKLDEVSKRAYELRLEFIKKFTGAKKHITDIMEYAVRIHLDDLYGYISINSKLFADILNFKMDDKERCNFDDVVKQTNKPIETIFAGAVYSMLEEPGSRYYTWDGSYNDNAALDMVYDFIEKLGYQISNEEQKLKKGTLAIFKTDEKCLEAKSTD